MTRRKVRLAYITNETERKASYKKRKKGLIKKVQELTTLCDVEACAIIYSQYDPEPVVWPSRQGAEAVLARFRRLSVIDQTRKMLNQETFTRQRIKKLEDQLRRARRENKRRQLENFMYSCLAGMADFQDFDIRDGAEMGWVVNQTLRDIASKLESSNLNGAGSSSASGSGNPPSDSVYGSALLAGPPPLEPDFNPNLLALTPPVESNVVNPNLLALPPLPESVYRSIIPPLPPPLESVYRHIMPPHLPPPESVYRPIMPPLPPLMEAAYRPIMPPVEAVYKPVLPALPPPIPAPAYNPPPGEVAPPPAPKTALPGYEMIESSPWNMVETPMELGWVEEMDLTYPYIFDGAAPSPFPPK